MKLKEYKTESYEFTKQTSDLVRQFAFAGIAIVWIFKFDDSSPHLIPSDLIKPLLFFVSTLIFDLLQYLFPSIIFSIFFLVKEKKFNGQTDIDIKAPNWFSVPGWICFVVKVIAISVGFWLLIKYLFVKL